MKFKFLTVVLSGVFFFTYCTSSRKAAGISQTVSYAKHIQPIVSVQCSPCHFPSRDGKKSSLETYEDVSMQINDIIRRIEYYPGTKGFMPMKKPRLSDSTIALFKTWKEEGMGK